MKPKEAIVCDLCLENEVKVFGIELKYRSKAFNLRRGLSRNPYIRLHLCQSCFGYIDEIFNKLSKPINREKTTRKGKSPDIGFKEEK